jgi:hypothetical protein
VFLNVLTYDRSSSGQIRSMVILRDGTSAAPFDFEQTSSVFWGNPHLSFRWKQYREGGSSVIASYRGMDPNSTTVFFDQLLGHPEAKAGPDGALGRE